MIPLRERSVVKGNDITMIFQRQCPTCLKVLAGAVIGSFCCAEMMIPRSEDCGLMRPKNNVVLFCALAETDLVHTHEGNDTDPTPPSG
jgi:hypothetical protein